MASALGLWRPENVALASDSSQIEQGGRHTGCSRRENAGAREKGWGKRAVPRAEIRRAWREERGRNQRAERGALAGKTDLPARPRERVRPRRREKLLPASLRLKNRLLLPLPSSPSARGAAAGGLLFPRRLLWSSIEQDTSHSASPYPLPHPRDRLLFPRLLCSSSTIEREREREREVGGGGGNGREETERWVEAEAAAAAQCRRDQRDEDTLGLLG